MSHKVLQFYAKFVLVHFQYIKWVYVMSRKQLVDLLEPQHGDSGKSTGAQTEIQLALNILWSITIQSWSVSDDS